VKKYEDLLEEVSLIDLYEGDFLGFVENIISPYMELPFIYEDYYSEWEKLLKKSRVGIMAARGHHKTEIITVCYTIYCAVYKLKQQQAIGSATYPQTQEIFDRIKYYFRNVPELQRFIPEEAKKQKTTNRWNDKKIVLTNGAIIHARSISGKWRGLHVNRIVLDDIITSDSTLSDEKTKSLVWGEIFNCITSKEGDLHVVGTPIRYTDILYDIKANKEFIFREFPAIKKDGELLAKNRRSMKELERIKKTIGSVRFSCEYLLNPLDDETSIIKKSHIENAFSREMSEMHSREEATKKGIERIYLGVDFAFSDRITANYFVALTLGVDSNGIMHVLNYVRKKGISGEEQFRLIKSLHESYNYDHIALEVNSIYAIKKNYEESGLPIKLYRTGILDKKTKQPKNNLNPRIDTLGKVEMITRLSTWFENRQIVIPYSTEEEREKAHRLRDEAVSFALEEGKLIEIGEHPDIPIALAYAIEVAKHETGLGFGFIEL